VVVVVVVVVVVAEAEGVACEPRINGTLPL
jgi:hypothetical protein